MARSAARRKDSHACRNLNTIIKQHGKKLPVEITGVPTMLRRSRKRKVESPINYPVLRLSSWADVIMDNGGHYFLGGRSLDEVDTFGDELETFWTRFKAVDPSFGFFKDTSAADWRWAVPMALHGDEGRGKAKKPVMVVALQTILPLRSGKGLSNMSGRLGHSHM